MPAWLVSLLSFLAPVISPLARWLEPRAAPAPAVALDRPTVDDGDAAAGAAARERAGGSVATADVTPVPSGEEPPR